MAGGSKASISVRKYIKWGDEPPSEPTSTLVLTSPKKYFVDTRLLMPTDSTHPITTIDWAFAGTSSTTPATTERPEHTVWKHWVDSTTPDAETMKDEGDMIALESGEVVERGTMVNPATSRMEAYEENWREIKPTGEKIGWVLKAEGQGARGMVVKIGGFAQGILRSGRELGIQRWRVGGRGWETVVGIGEFEIPGQVWEMAGNVAEGEKFVGREGLEWVCVERFEGAW